MCINQNKIIVIEKSNQEDKTFFAKNLSTVKCDINRTIEKKLKIQTIQESRQSQLRL